MTRQIEGETSSYTFAEQIFARFRLNGPGVGEIDGHCDALPRRQAFERFAITGDGET